MAEQKGPDGRDWIGKIERRHRQLKRDWMDDADKVVKIYECKNPDEIPFNILYSNTETILPSLYNSTPRPEVSRRWNVVNPQDRALDIAVSQVSERTLEYLADTNQAEFESYSDAIKAAVVGFLVPGLGQARVRYHEDGKYQTISFDPVSYDRFVWGYARQWKNVPWVAFGHDLQKSEFEATYPEFCKSEEYKKFDWEKLEKDDYNEDGKDRPAAKAGVLVWECWDYASRTVYHVCETFKEKVLHEEPYPERLTGRFPCPKPLMFTRKFKDLMPIPSYKVYEKQAEELNLLSRKIIKIERAIKVRGVYNGAAPELIDLMNQDDENILVPVSQATVSDGVDKMIWMLPIDQLVAALQNLYAAREQCKQVIYEILGIGDILRGTSDPNETAKAQQIKNNWGSMRIKKGQKDVQDFCLELFRLAFEYSVSYFTPATFQSITKLPYLFEQQKQQVQMAMQQFQAQQQQAQQMAQQAAQQAQAAGQQPPPPPPQGQPPVPPYMQQAAQMPSWEQIVKTLQDSFERTYRIDIETNSTVDLESTEDKQDISEFMNAFGQMTAGFEKLLASGQVPFDAFKLIMGETFRRFRFGRKVQDALDMMQPPKQQQDPEQVKKQAMDQAKAQIDKVQADAARQMAKMQEQMTQQQAETSKLSVQLQELKSGMALKDKEVAVGQREQQFNQARELHATKTDYQGKLGMQQQQHAEGIAKMREQMFGAMGQQMSGMGGMLKQIQQIQQMLAMQAKKDDQEDAQEQAQQQQLAQALQSLLQTQDQMMQGMQQLGQLVAADRESEITVTPDGRKKGRSRIVPREQA